MRPRWRTLAKTKKSPPFIVGTAGGREVPEGTPGLIFFRPFFVQRQRKDIQNQPAQRATWSRSMSVRSRRKQELLPHKQPDTAATKRKKERNPASFA